MQMSGRTAIARYLDSPRTAQCSRSRFKTLRRFEQARQLRHRRNVRLS
jgi:hypothetical protein